MRVLLANSPLQPEDYSVDRLNSVYPSLRKSKLPNCTAIEVLAENCDLLSEITAPQLPDSDSAAIKLQQAISERRAYALLTKSEKLVFASLVDLTQNGGEDQFFNDFDVGRNIPPGKGVCAESAYLSHFTQIGFAEHRKVGTKGAWRASELGLFALNNDLIGVIKIRRGQIIELQ